MSQYFQAMMDEGKLGLVPLDSFYALKEEDRGLWFLTSFCHDVAYLLPIFFSLRNVGYDPSYTKCQLTHGSFKFFLPRVLIAHSASISPSKHDNYFLH